MSFPEAASSSAKTASKERVSTSQQITKRLQQELMDMMINARPGISAFPLDDSAMTEWTATIVGSEGVYDGLKFKLNLHFPSTYPYKPPVVRFETTCFHPNVDMQGNICIDILKEKWSPTLSVSSILLSLQSLLADANCDSPLNTQASDLWDDQVAFKAELMRHYKEPVEEW